MEELLRQKWDYNALLNRHARKVLQMYEAAPSTDEWYCRATGLTEEEYRVEKEIHAKWAVTDEAYRAEGEKLAPAFKTLPFETQVHLIRISENVTAITALLSLLTQEEFLTLQEEIEDGGGYNCCDYAEEGYLYDPD